MHKPTSTNEPANLNQGLQAHSHYHEGHVHHDGCSTAHNHGFDYVYWGSILAVVLAYAAHFFGMNVPLWRWNHFNHQVFEVMNSMWWGVVLGILAISVMNLIPREMVMTYFKGSSRFMGLLRATMAGTLFDLCNHGILMLGMKIYERGASLGQTMAFLIASPWNSFSFSLILYALIGGELTFLFLVLSLVVALISGWIFEVLVDRQILPGNPVSQVEVDPLKLKIHVEWTWSFWGTLLKNGLRESKMIIKWILFGALLSALVSCFISPDAFADYFGKSFRGLLLTLLAATGLEVCSEGSVPLAADLVNVAHAPGNAFIFLMAGAATDLTEILLIRQTMKSWKVALALPLITVPQIILVGILMNLDLFNF